ncbi:kinase D-interacting substrate of 220 kDa B-like [Littorina saxatilis]|uniref:KAP NTPase domain-containing protein n=1 Tax=Littorina saxatilis TaxID=31220 RepID=A0AAN9G7Y4_9CAEN
MAHFKARMLWESIEKGDLTAVHGLLESGNINLEERDDSGRTFLMVASEKGELNIVRELLEAGVDPNAVDNESWSALLCASKEGHLEIVIELLEHQALLEHKDMCGWTALMWASYKGRIIVVQELLDRSANPNAKADHHMTSLAWAAGRGHTEIVQMLISKGAKVNTADKYGTTPLIWACRKGYIDIVEALLAEGANADACGMNSWTPLLVATRGGHSDVVHSLLQHDPNVNATDKDGLTALAIAAREGHVEIVQDLLSKGAYVNVADRNGDSILIHSVKGGQVEVVRALLDKYVDVDVQGSEDKTSLYWAVEKGYNEIVRLLIAAEPDLELCTKDEDTALLRAVRSRNEECVRLLLEKGAKVSASDKRGDTALHIAIRARSKRITELLLRNPRNSRLLYRPNKAGETPYAMDTYHQRGILQGIYGHRNLNASDAENLLGYDIYSSALADILSDPSLSTPITVGLYAKWGSGKSFLISKLQSEMKSFTQQSTDEHFTLTLTVVLLALFFSLVVGEALVLGVSLKVGIGVSVAIFLLQIVFFVIVMICDQRYDMKAAIKISTVLGQRQRLLMLLLRMLFCNPRRSPKAEKKTVNQYSVRFLFSDCTKLTSVGGEKALAAMIGTLCQAVEREYGFIITRLFRVYKPADNVHKKGRFKSMCCIPYFVLVLLVLCCIAAGVALLVQFRIKEYIAVDGILIAIACVLTLTLVGNIYTWAQTLMALVSSQKRRVMKAADQVDTLKMDGFLQRLKHEVELMSRMILCMDAFTADQTRLVVIVDGLDSCEQSKVLQVLDTVKSLFCDENAPYITILAVDPHIIIKGIEHNLKSNYQDSNVNGFDYLRNVVHLPFYLQTQGLRMQHHDSVHEDRDRTVAKLGPQESVISTSSLEGNKSGARRKGRSDTLSGSQPQIYTSSYDLSNTFARNDYFSDINPRSMRRLMNIVSVTARLLRAYNIDFKWHRLAAWINIIEQWPYRVSWIIYFFEEAEVLDNSTSLCTLYQRVLPRIPMTKESEPLLEIDRNARKLEAFLSSQSASLPRLNVGDLRKFLPCTINLDPYLRKLIRETEHQNEIMRQEINTMGGMYPFAPPFPPPPPSSSIGTADTLSTLSGIRPAPQGSSPSRLVGSRLPSGGYIPGMMGSNMMGANMMGGSTMGGFGQMQHSVGPNMAPSGMSLSSYTSPSRPHPSVFFSDASQLAHWSERDVEGVCSLIALLKGVTPDVMGSYTQRVRENNIRGLVLQNCDLDELRTVLQMRFGDWQLFKAAILSLREWDGCLLNAESPADGPNNNSASVRTTTSTPAVSGKESNASSRERPGNKYQQERVMLGSRGRKMRRNDSIIKQLSYEAAILHEALEEFSEDSDGDEAVLDDLSLEDMTLPASLSTAEASRPTTASNQSSVPSSDHPPTIINEHTNLSSLITVLDAPRSSDVEGAEAADPSSPFLLQSSFPSDMQLPTAAVGETVEDLSEGEPDPHRHRHLFKQLSTGLGKITRPIISVFDHHRHPDNQHHHFDEEGGEHNADRIALMPMHSEASSVLPAENPQDAESVSPWDRPIFAPSQHSHSPVHQTQVTVEVPPTPRPVFSVGSDDESSLAQTTITMESETLDCAGAESSGIGTPRHSVGSVGDQELWQAHAQTAGPSRSRSGSEIRYEGGGVKPDKDKESFV